MVQVYELELPMLGAPQDFFTTFYADHAEWTRLQHEERGDKGVQNAIPKTCATRGASHRACS